MSPLRPVLAALPHHLGCRVRTRKDGDCNASGFVLYWMRSALRAHENPALDVAIVAARQLRVPLVVLLHVEDQYPHATARRQNFLVEGARAALKELRLRGLTVSVQVDRAGSRQRPQFTLAERAALVVTEEPFCVPWLAAVEALLEHDFSAPLLLADCCSVVPSSLIPPSACHRAYTFEQAARQMKVDLCKAWTEELWSEPEACLGIDPGLDLERADLSALVSEMDVDMSVPAVRHTTGGSSHGYDRWKAWVAGGGLDTYARRRNDSLDVHGVSRMSAYLNAGMVSPMRIAREASNSKGAGKAKFLAEFLTWRGVTYAHCYHFPMPATGATLAQLPRWAQDTLQKHANDPRRDVRRDALKVGQTGDRAWDGMQQYLVETGELHNNARMGWGKAVVAWTASPQDALEALVELNNTFALDGHAPPSYGGLLGCLGLFEGPKGESAVLGKVSYRPPKAKYATMPTLVGQLQKQACWLPTAKRPKTIASELTLPAMFSSSMSTRGDKGNEQQPLEQSPKKRRWVAKLRGFSDHTIDLS